MDSEIDAIVKTHLLNDTLDLVNFRPYQDYWVLPTQAKAKSQQIANRQKYEPRFIRTSRGQETHPLPFLKTPSQVTLVKFPPVQERRRLTTRLKTRSTSRQCIRGSVEAITVETKVDLHTQEDEEVDFLMSVRKNMKSVKSYNTPGGDVAELQAAAEAAEPKPMDEGLRRMVEEMTRTRPIVQIAEDRTVACGNYELVCPLDPVLTRQETEQSLLMLKQGKKMANGGHVIQQSLSAVITKYRDSH